MAKQRSNATKNPANVFSAVVSTVGASIVSTLSAWATLATDAQTKRHSLSAQLLADIVTLRSNAPDETAYRGAIETLFGNGLKHTQKGMTRGSVYESLKAAKVEERTCLTTLSYARTVAKGIWPDAMYAKAKSADATFRSMYDALKTTKATTTVVAKPSGLADAQISADTSTDTVEQIVSKLGIAKVLTAVAHILRADKATDFEGMTIESLARKFSVK